MGAEAPPSWRFRANPRYELVLFDRLTPAERRALARLREEPGFYGVLRPREGAGLSVKAVDRETALLLLTLAEPGPLPSYLPEVLGAACARTVARLVADGALEVESGGAFLSGPAALGLLPGISGEAGFAAGSRAELDTGPGLGPALGRTSGTRAGAEAEPASGTTAGTTADRPAGPPLEPVSGTTLGTSNIGATADPPAGPSAGSATGEPGCLFPSSPEAARATVAPRGRLAELSLAALGLAALLPIDDPAVLAARLYAYNRRPLTPGWARLLPGAEEVRAWLGIAPGGAAAAALAAWKPVPAHGTWLLWSARRAPPPAGPTFKLYLSPQPEAAPAAFAEALAVLPGAGAWRLKAGSDAAGMLRPDKMVAYFGDLDRLAAAAEALSARLAGAPAQGVPFTARIAGDGLLSWGAEPSDARRLPGGRESWRLWLVNRMASALVEARAAGGGEPWRFALERLRLEGVDTATWAPRALFWAEG